MSRVVVLAKAPVPGRVKTRLCPPFDPSGAAALAEAALADTLAAVADTEAADRVLVLDGPPGPWLPPGFRIVPQRSGDLGERLAGAFRDAGAPALLIGMDTPQVTAPLLEGGLAVLGARGVDAVLGPAEDGGWWALGLREADPRVFREVPMSTPITCGVQRRRLRALGLRTVDLPELRDVDRFDDARAVALAAPATRFARAFRDLAPEAVRVRMRLADGGSVPLPVERWLGDAAPEELELLERVLPPVLDVGCGPGRHALALARRGVVALGVDVSPVAVRLSRLRGAPVLRRSVFGRVPGAGRWGTVLLVDGNIGIGGDPVGLLSRASSLVRSGGRVLAELEPPGAPTDRMAARLEVAGTSGRWFPWARVGVDAVARLAGAAGLAVEELWDGGGRWFAALRA